MEEKVGGLCRMRWSQMWIRMLSSVEVMFRSSLRAHGGVLSGCIAVVACLGCLAGPE